MGNTIFLTAGHHNKDSGAIGNGYKENALNMELRDMITQRIKQLNPNIKVWNDDDNDTLSQVIAKINKVATSNDILLEVHFDASLSPKSSGGTALIADGAREKSQLLGAELVNIGSTVLKIPNRGVWNEKKSNRGRLGILHTPASSVLYEVGFISNPTDMINHQDWKHWLADEFARILIKAAS